ncbi:topoisomerase DNA binding C4 zinc finger domain protein [Methylophaga aminisulfidivorans MP]|jgi:very-short-patch-repair endonuclease|uniref:Topoisomerase DNA binding C4 zinc finger domain protein n=1 Tax=Methylophaga aminisulfidivorans MP TaxID=1026882 RepID=F5SUF8_9GAMM|nr:DUF2726 domain-containing protein [Methylophaga aminisulfidivorans]EGL55526.1 topoisomerase DNA binding C4 zinc finger domain protein [Methylophaga aminisulfidivorans MP]
MSFVFIGLFIVILVAVLLLALMKDDKDKTEKTTEYPYSKQPSLLTPAELSFQHSLKLAVDGQYDISSKVRLADIVTVKQTKSKSEWQKAFNKIQSKHVDFVLTDTKTADILCAIELDDSSHEKPARRLRDDFLDNVLRVARVPLIRFTVEQSYQSQSIAEKIKNAIHPEFAIQFSSDVVMDDIKILINPDR